MPQNFARRGFEDFRGSSVCLARCGHVCTRVFSVAELDRWQLGCRVVHVLGRCLQASTDTGVHLRLQKNCYDPAKDVVRVVWFARPGVWGNSPSL